MIMCSFIYIYIDSSAEDRRSSSCALIYIYIYIDSTAEDRRSSSCALIYIYTVKQQIIGEDLFDLFDEIGEIINRQN